MSLLTPERQREDKRKKKKEKKEHGGIGDLVELQEIRPNSRTPLRLRWSAPSLSGPLQGTPPTHGEQERERRRGGRACGSRPLSPVTPLSAACLVFWRTACIPHLLSSRSHRPPPPPPPWLPAVAETLTPFVTVPGRAEEWRRETRRRPVRGGPTGSLFGFTRLC